MSAFATWLRETGEYDWSQYKRDLADLCAQQHEALERIYSRSAAKWIDVATRDALRAAEEFRKKYEI